AREAPHLQHHARDPGVAQAVRDGGDDALADRELVHAQARPAGGVSRRTALPCSRTSPSTSIPLDRRCCSAPGSEIAVQASRRFPSPVIRRQAWPISPSADVVACSCSLRVSSPRASPFCTNAVTVATRPLHSSDATISCQASRSFWYPSGPACAPAR